ncbi:phosphate ABC transporter substrate-binding protein PstS [Nocardioides sp. zg-1228]|uniref:phosphate ABC transporter substrate-binding protein PstS n=1 Tax=Nocardioides sp. zg-1228 TaxID=2763008 RepID=UPI001643367E|nr:phosphate ABC transporter substrate-binding protein PstS [Nocardioides sp. zg-1228]MBC2931677.1 phosphate ABC transporter substrate-binding protein PstS [Nocardioides sp. zg-1228]QSF57266.1 phosphate ABC transporter substrate-binding protein PstS [Nocardioides sp. zg-1228]
MNRTSLRTLLAPSVAVLTLSLSLTACGGGNSADEAAAATGGPGDGDFADLSGELAIGGASSQESAQNAWMVGFSEVAPGVTVSYDPVGSGGGRENFISGGFPTAGTDSYLDDEEGELSAATERCGSEPITIPNYVSPIAVVYHLEGVDELNLSPETLARIFAGDITRWDDEAIVADNPDADLPSEDITPVHRSDESGTTGNFTHYLSTVAGDAWPHGEVEQWPNEAGGESGKGTSGVVQVVTDAPHTIGYADASQAGGLGQAHIGVGDEFVAPSAEAAAKIFEVSPRLDEDSAVNMAYELDYTTEEAGVYPIVLTSYMVACESYDDEATASNVRAYLTYILSDEGQEMGQSEAGSAPLTATVISEAQAIVDTISAG